MGKLFHSQVFGSLDEFLKWVDENQERVAIVSVVGTSNLTVTYAEAMTPSWRSGTNFNIQVLRSSFLEIKD